MQGRVEEARERRIHGSQVGGEVEEGQKEKMTTAGELRAVAGLAISHCGGGSAADYALLKLRDSCEGAIPYAESDQPPPAKPLEPPVTTIRVPSTPQVPAGMYGVPVPCTQTGIHRYDIHTQRCKTCGRTYLDIVGHRAEFMP